jgi:hypothetical protein
MVVVGLVVATAAAAASVNVSLTFINPSKLMRFRDI